MKKIYLLSLLCCASIAAFSQSYLTVWSAAAAGTYTTGYATATGRNDNNIVTTATTNRGYAVFDLTGIPAGSVINACKIGFYVSNYTGSGAPSGWNTIGFAGDLSTVTAPATLFGDIAAPPGTSLATTTYGTGIGLQRVVSNAAIISFIQANLGSKVSICFTGGAGRTYTIKGENGSTADTTTTNHAPYLAIDYCEPPTAVTATASPTTLCEGDVLNLIGTGAASGTLAWSWAGPGGYSDPTAMSPSFIADPTSTGVYTLTVTNVCGTSSASTTATTASVLVNPLPTAIFGPSSVCTGSAISLSGAPSNGTWISSLTGVATIGATTGLLTGLASGSTVISYTLPSGCYITTLVDDNDPPAAILGPDHVCVGDFISLSNAVGGGTWSDDLSGLTYTDPVFGSVNGLAAGTATISYTTPGCAIYAIYNVTVNDLPAPIFAPATDVCEGGTIALSDASIGTWASTLSSTASVDASGNVSALSAGSADIVFTDILTGCQVSQTIIVDALPAAIGGTTNVCEAGTTTLTETSGPGVWTTADPAASVSGGAVTGVSAGVADITFTILGTGCYTTTAVTVNPLPAAISGASFFCQGTNTTFTDADAGGTWTSGNGSVATIAGPTGVASGVATGVFAVIYTLPTGCATNMNVSVNPSPLSVVTAAGPTTFCAGSSVVLSGSSVAGYTYQWELNNTPITGETNITYTANATGLYTLLTENTVNCTTASSPVSITAGIVATLSNPSSLSICIGKQTELTVSKGNATGVVTYQWNKNGAAIPGAADSFYYATSSGLYNCEITISGGAGACSAASDTDMVVVHALPIPAITFNGSQLATTSPYSGYQWYVNTVSIAGANSRTLTPPGNGIYSIKVTDGNGCDGISSTFPLTNVGVAEVGNGAHFSVTPNPATTVLHITSPVTVRAIITTVAGKVVADQTNAQDIDINKLANGMYLISLFDGSGNKVATEKFVKE